ncbi:MAG: hypothetical protein ACO1OQ_08000 [Rufibacter sp.]
MPEVRRILSKFKVLVQVLAVDDKVIDLALPSKFKDFEDAIQYLTAIESGIKLLLTRNLKDYKKAEIPVQTPELFLKGMEVKFQTSSNNILLKKNLFFLS